MTFRHPYEGKRKALFMYVFPVPKMEWEFKHLEEGCLHFSGILESSYLAMAEGRDSPLQVPFTIWLDLSFGPVSHFSLQSYLGTQDLMGLFACFCEVQQGAALPYILAQGRSAAAAAAKLLQSQGATWGELSNTGPYGYSLLNGYIFYLV